MNKYNINLKPCVSSSDMLKMSPYLFRALSYFLQFSKDRGLPVLITNILEKYSVSKSNTHPEGRAIDFSSRGWTQQDIDDCVEFMNIHCEDIGAISISTGKSRILFYHDAGLGPHFHLQVRRR